jgi:NAD(P)-dependent dehydrogenase (short-subunit alcohol dehydrogenase family)
LAHFSSVVSKSDVHESAGQVGPITDVSASKYQDADVLGEALFQESAEAWAKLYAINTFSIHFVTAAFLGLLAKGSKETQDYTSCVINITSISGLAKLSQNHVMKFPFSLI